MTALAGAAIAVPGASATTSTPLPVPLGGLCQVPAAALPATTGGHGLPGLFCVRTSADLERYLDASSSPFGHWLAGRVTTRAATGYPRFCVGRGATDWATSPDLTGDGRDDVITVSYRGCTPRISLEMTLLDGRSGRVRWHVHASGYFPLVDWTRAGHPLRNAVLVSSYDDRWTTAAYDGKPYRGTALAMQVIDDRGRTLWRRSVAAVSRGDGTYSGPTFPQLGSVISGRSTDLVYSHVDNEAIAAGLPVTTTTVTNTFVDGRNGHAVTDPPLRVGPMTAAYPQIVADLDADGRDDYVLVGGFEADTPVGVYLPGVGVLPPSLHRLVVEAHRARDHAVMWSRTFDVSPFAFFVGTSDFDGDQLPEVDAFVFPGAFDDDVQALLLAGSSGATLVQQPGWPAGALRVGHHALLLAVGRPFFTDTLVGVTLDGFGIAGRSQHITTLQVPMPDTGSNTSGGGVTIADIGDLNSDGLDDLGLAVDAESGGAQNHASTIVGSDESVHPAPLAFSPDQKTGWVPLYASVDGRGDDLIRTDSGRHRLDIDFAVGLRQRRILSVTLTGARKPTAAYPEVLTHGYGAGCRPLVVGANWSSPRPSSLLVLVDPHTGRTVWRRAIDGHPPAMGVTVRHPGPGRC